MGATGSWMRVWPRGVDQTAASTSRHAHTVKMACAVHVPPAHAVHLLCVLRAAHLQSPPPPNTCSSLPFTACPTLNHLLYGWVFCSSSSLRPVRTMSQSSSPSPCAGYSTCLLPPYFTSPHPLPYTSPRAHPQRRPPWPAPTPSACACARPARTPQPAKQLTAHEGAGTPVEDGFHCLPGGSAEGCAKMVADGDADITGLGGACGVVGHRINRWSTPSMGCHSRGAALPAVLHPLAALRSCTLLL